MNNLSSILRKLSENDFKKPYDLDLNKAQILFLDKIISNLNKIHKINLYNNFMNYNKDKRKETLKDFSKFEIRWYNKYFKKEMTLNEFNYYIKNNVVMGQDGRIKSVIKGIK